MLVKYLESFISQKSVSGDLWRTTKTLIMMTQLPLSLLSLLELVSQPTITCSKLTIETVEQGVKYVQS